MNGTHDEELARQAWLVVPLFNEALVIENVVRNARQTFPNIVCVDDGSSDDSARSAERGGAHVVQHPINLGQGAALQTGFEWVLTYTDAKYVVTFDADGQHRTSDALAMVARAEAEDLGFVLGSRFLGESHQAGFLKRLVLTTVAKLSALRGGLRLTDAHNGLRVLRRDVVAALRLRQNRMAHASEITGQLAHIDVKWAEHPVTIDYTDYSRSKGQSLLNGVNILTDLTFGSTRKP